jgi:hypothetical protein
MTPIALGIRVRRQMEDEAHAPSIEFTMPHRVEQIAIALLSQLFVAPLSPSALASDPIGNVPQADPGSASLLTMPKPENLFRANGAWQQLPYMRAALCRGSGSKGIADFRRCHWRQLRVLAGSAWHRRLRRTPAR